MKEFQLVSKFDRLSFATNPKRVSEDCKKRLKSLHPGEEWTEFRFIYNNLPDRGIEITVIGKAKTKKIKMHEPKADRQEELHPE